MILIEPGLAVHIHIDKRLRREHSIYFNVIKQAQPNITVAVRNKKFSVIIMLLQGESQKMQTLSHTYLRS